MSELISVIVPVYNVEKYLEKCVNSIIKQTYHKIEIILVDDGSTDYSSKICDNLLKEDKRIKVIHKKNEGLSSARNAGLEIAKGKYVFFIDSDDYIAKEMIEELYTLAIKHNADITIANRYHIFENGKKIIKFNRLENELKLNKIEAIFELNNFKYFDMSACGKLYKKALFSNIKFPLGKKCEDFYIMYLLFDLSEVIIYDSKPLYYYFQRKGSISKNKNLNMDFLYAAKEQMNYIEKKYPKLINCVKTSYISANMTIYNMAIQNHIKIEKPLLKKLQTEVKNNYKYIKENNSISKMKKIQTRIFITSVLLYKLFYKIYKFKEET